MATLQTVEVLSLLTYPVLHISMGSFGGTVEKFVDKGGEMVRFEV